MEEEKERESQRAEEKETDETEESAQAAEGAVLSCQEGTSTDDSDLPIMHWEALSLRIVELERQEEERKERLKSSAEVDRENVSVGWMDERDGGSWWEDVEADRSRRITALTSRFHNQKNLQLCFINDSDSEDDEGEEVQLTDELVGSYLASRDCCCPMKPYHQGPVHTGMVQSSRAGRGCGQAVQAPPPVARGLKMEVRAALRALRDKLWTEQKQERLACAATLMERRLLTLGELQALSLLELSSLRAELTQAIHDLSSELVNRLLTRDQLRTEQDAMLLDVEDMTSL